MSIITVGIDLAKNIFAVHGVNEHGKTDYGNAVCDDCSRIECSDVGLKKPTSVCAEHFVMEKNVKAKNSS